MTLARFIAGRLDAEWAGLAYSPQARTALQRWAQQEPALAGFADLQQLRATINRRGDPAGSDRLLAALVRLAAVTGPWDTLAGRVVLQALLPGAVRLGHSLAAMVGDAATSQALVLSELAVGIGTYPYRSRPSRVAANLLLDCRQRITRDLQRAGAEQPDGLLTDDHDPRLGTVDHLDDVVAARHLLWWARRRGVLSRFEVQLLVAIHADDVPLAQLTVRFGRSRSTLYAVASSATRRLRDAVGERGRQERLPVGTAQLVARHRAGSTVRDLARWYQLDRYTVSQRLRQSGVPLHGGPVEVQLDPATVGEIIAAYQGGESLATVGRRFGLSKDKIARTLDEAGVSRRTRSQAQHEPGS